MNDHFENSSEEHLKEEESLSFAGFWITLITKPRLFFEQYYQHDQSPYFWIVFVIFSMFLAMDRFDTQLLKMEMRGDLAAIALVNQWPIYWGIVLFGGVIGGGLYYYIGGWWFNVRIGWSGGKKDSETARFLYMYSMFPAAAVTVLMTMGAAMTKPTPYQVGSEDASVGFLVPLFFLFYSMFICHTGVRSLTGASRWGSLIWFVILPSLVYLALFGVVIAALMAI